MDQPLNFQHKSLAGGRWQTFSFMEQMANVGSEIGRALSWREKGNSLQSERAIERALELLYFTIEDPRNRHRLRELARLREVVIDYFFGTNEYGSTPQNWRSYFDPFALAACRHR